MMCICLRLLLFELPQFLFFISLSLLSDETESLLAPPKAPMVVVVSRSFCLKTIEAIFHMTWFGIVPCMSVPSLDLLVPFFTTTFSFLLQKYSPREITTSSPKSDMWSPMRVDTSDTVTKDTGWESGGVGMGILIWGVDMDGMGG